jgi:hypothetical protein
MKGDRMKIKTYPLQFTEEYLEEIADKAKENGMSIKEFIQLAIKEKMDKGVQYGANQN